MIEVNSVVLEDEIEYIVVANIKENGSNYLYLVNKENKSDCCIRKIIKENEIEYIVPLNDEVELNKAIEMFK